MQSRFAQYAKAITKLDPNNLGRAALLPEDLLIARDGAVTMHYAPFDAINKDARIVLLGITPGMTQTRNALAAARRQLQSGASEEVALKAAKQTGAFSGEMRDELVAMLDHIGLQKRLGIVSCEALFNSHAHLVHTTSALRYPVFVGGKDYNGTPNMLKHPMLRRQVLEHLVPELKALDQALVIPLGDAVNKMLASLIKEGYIEENRILLGMPHPSPANRERIHYFVGKKLSGLSVKTNTAKLDLAKAGILRVLGAA